MKYFFKSLILCGTFLMAFNSFAAAPSIKALNAQQLQQTLIGKQIKITGIILWNVNKQALHETDTATVKFNKNGTMHGMLAEQLVGGPKLDSGTWLIKRNQLCVHWQHWNNHQPHCFALYPTHFGYVFIDQDNIFSGFLARKNIQ